MTIIEKKLQSIVEIEDAKVEDIETLSYIMETHQMVYEGQRTPLQAIRDKLKHESKTMSPDELDDTLLALMKESKKSLQESYKEGATLDEMHIFEECLGFITEDIYKRIYHSYNANDIIGELETKRKILDKIHRETENYGNHYADTILAENEEDRLKAHKEMDTSGNILMLLQYAVRCDVDVAQEFVRYIKNHDMSQLSAEDCRSLIPQIRDEAKAASQERAL